MDKNTDRPIPGGGVPLPDDVWLSEIKKEIRRLNGKLAALSRKQKNDEMTQEDWDDYENWSGWRGALKWAILLRAGKATREDAWGKRDGNK